MHKTRITALAVAIAAATGIASINPATADDSRVLLAQAAPTQDPVRTERGPRGPGGDRPQFFSPEERQQFEQKMRNAKTPEDRDAARKEMRAAVELRAKEKGIALPERGNKEHRPMRPRPDGDAKPHQHS